MSEKIRRAVPADVPAVRAVTDAAYRPYIERIGRPPAPMQADHAANVAAGRVFVTGGPATGGTPGLTGDPATGGFLDLAGEPLTGGLLGLVVLVPGAGQLLLESIAVHPDAHGRGIGRALLAFADARARALGVPDIRLYTHALMWENQKIYPRYGYEVVEPPADDPYDRVHYRKRLS